MTDSLHVLTLTKPQSDLLQILSRNELVAQVHAAVTASIGAKSKTNYALNQMDIHMAILDILKWRTTDAERAYRHVKLAVIVRLLDLVNNAVTDIMDERTAFQYNLHHVDILEMLAKSLNSPADKANVLTQMKRAEA